ncbi:hypothetical protein OH77DRAFT_294920 [Trametes cingulata]|nr:hypothetical protein OH77DRAFT_294920 [Trametes cingulata]
MYPSSRHKHMTAYARQPLLMLLLPLASLLAPIPLSSYLLWQWACLSLSSVYISLGARMQFLLHRCLSYGTFWLFGVRDRDCTYITIPSYELSSYSNPRRVVPVAEPRPLASTGQQTRRGARAGAVGAFRLFLRA